MVEKLKIQDFSYEMCSYEMLFNNIFIYVLTLVVRKLKAPFLKCEDMSRYI